MRTTKNCGILEIGQLPELPGNDSGVRVRTEDGQEFVIPLDDHEVRAIGKEDLLYRNVTMTITFEPVYEPAP